MNGRAVTVAMSLLISSCMTFTQEDQCASLRRNVEAAQSGFARYKAGPWIESSSGERKWTIPGALDNWQECTILESERWKSNKMSCQFHFDAGKYDEASTGYEKTVASIKNCIIMGSEAPYFTSAPGRSLESVKFSLPQASDELYAVSIEVSLGTSDGTTIYLDIEGKRRFTTVH